MSGTSESAHSVTEERKAACNTVLNHAHTHNHLAISPPLSNFTHYRHRFNMPGGHENYYYRLEGFCMAIGCCIMRIGKAPPARHLMDNKVLSFSLMKIQDWVKVSNLFHNDIFQEVSA